LHGRLHAGARGALAASDLDPRAGLKGAASRRAGEDRVQLEWRRQEEGRVRE